MGGEGESAGVDGEEVVVVEGFEGGAPVNRAVDVMIVAPTGGPLAEATVVDVPDADRVVVDFETKIVELRGTVSVANTVSSDELVSVSDGFLFGRRIL